jgi:hypothetical protein
MTTLFTERQPRGGSAVFEEKPRSAVAYKGAERRRRHRRGQADRRLEMRFELDKADRRVSAGRRADDKNIRFW